MNRIHFSLAALALATLTACSSGPSDSDIRALATQSLAQADQQLKPAGISINELFDVQVKVLNKADQGNNRWLVETETTLVPKKSITELPTDVQLVLGASMGQFQKGQALPASRSSTVVTQGDKGWMPVN
jgi:hypothetical protein